MPLIRSGSVSSGRNSRPRRLSNNKAGFSLVEVLAALLVTMLLVMTVTPFVSQMLATWARGGETAELVELKTRGIGQLREDLRRAIALNGLGRIDELAVFEGDETSMSFPVVAGLGRSGTGIEYLSFRVGNGINGPALVRRRAPIIGSTYGAFTDPVVLFSGPYRYLFKYYTREGEQVTVWSKGRMDLPARVDLDIVGHNGQLVLRLPIAVPIFASLSASCIASRGGMGCPSISVAEATAAMNEALAKFGFVPPGQGSSGQGN